jgi:hypothetical protein
MEFLTTNTPPRAAAKNGLAIVGFVALVLVGMWLAIYSARFVPTAVSRLGAAAVYLGSVFTPPSAPTLTVIPTASTTLPFDGATTTSATTSAPATSNTTPTKPTPSYSAPKPGQETSTTTQISGATRTGALYGLPDLAVTIDQVGYLATTSAESFIASSTVPHGSRPAIVFTVRNVGTNVSSVWNFTAQIPTQTAYVYTAPNQQALNPGDSIQFTLGFDQATAGATQKISLHLSPGGSDANTANNDAATTLTILGS